MATVRVTYLEQLAPPPGVAALAPMAGASIALESLDIESYLTLWRAIGEPLGWTGRMVLPRQDLIRLLAIPLTQIYVLRVEGTAAGLCEFSRADPPDSEIAYFGLAPKYQSKKLGPFLLDRALRDHWRQAKPHRIWLHTETNDDARAIPVYSRAGFRTFAVHDLTYPPTETAYRSAIGLD